MSIQYGLEEERTTLDYDCGSAAVISVVYGFLQMLLRV